MHLELMRRAEAELPLPDDLEGITSARIWHCKFKTLAPLADLTNLQTLVIATYPDDSFEPLSTLGALTDLRILHFPRAKDLAPLVGLGRLETLSLQSLPSWDSAGKVLTVESFEPLASLARLRHLELFGVQPARGGLEPLFRLTGIESARISKLPEEDVKEFFERTGADDSFNPQPAFDE